MAIALPSCASAASDILPLTRHFFRGCNRTPATVSSTFRYSGVSSARYPGNVRDLRHLVTRMRTAMSVLAR